MTIKKWNTENESLRISKVRNNLLRFVWVILLAVTLAACSDDPVQPSATTIDGRVTAPGGAIAQFKQSNISNSMLAALFGSELQAAVTGLSAVSDATVELIRIDTTGEYIGEVIASTMSNSEGEFRLETTEVLGNNLVLRVSSPSETINAFAVSTNVDISPISEYVFSSVIDQVNSGGTASMDNITNEMIMSLTEYVEGLSVFLAPSTIDVAFEAIDSVAKAAGINDELAKLNAIDLTGSWSVISVTGPNSCGDDEGISESFNIIMTQTGDSLLIELSPSEQISVQVSGNQIINFPLDTGFDDGGTYTETAFTLTIEDMNTITGQITWDWNDGSFFCSGTDNLEITRI